MIRCRRADREINTHSSAIFTHIYINSSAQQTRTTKAVTQYVKHAEVVSATVQLNGRVTSVFHNSAADTQS